MRISDWSSDVCSSDLASALTQYSDQLTLIIQLRRDFRQNDGFAMANQAGIEPSEQRRKFRGGEPALGRVIRIVQTQANDLWCLAERWTKCDVVDVDFFTFRCGLGGTSSRLAAFANDRIQTVPFFVADDGGTAYARLTEASF